MSLSLGFFKRGNAFWATVAILLLTGFSMALAHPQEPSQAVKQAFVAPERILGIFGGMGPEATANFYQEVVRLTPAKKDQEHIPTLIYSFPQVPDRTVAIRSGDRSIIPYLVEGVKRLEKAGASFIAIPCNTAHYFFDDMQRAVSIPILHMIRETAEVVVRKYAEKRIIGLLATNGTLSTGLYQKELEKRGFTVLVPDESDQNDLVMKAIYEIKSAGDRKQCEDWLAVAGEHLEKRGAQVIVLGCTEIPLAFNTARARVPVVNATRVLAEAAIRMFQKGK